jgi:hypothetical protein
LRSKELLVVGYQASKQKVRVELILRPAVTRPVRLSIGLLFGAKDYFLLHNILGTLYYIIFCTILAGLGTVATPLYPQKLALTSPRSGGRSVGIVPGYTTEMYCVSCEVRT